MNDVIRVGVVGTGQMAGTMVKAFRQLPGFEVRAVSSGDPARAQAFAVHHGIPEAASGLEDLLSRDSVRMVYVANANELHASTTLSALQAGKSVLCEKPFAVSLAEGQSVIAAARRTKQVFLEAMWTPHLPAYRRLFELVDSGAIGEATHLHADFGYPMSPDMRASRLAPGPGGGVLLDRGVYPIALAIRLFGPPQKVQAVIKRDANGVDVTASVQLAHAAGRHSQLTCSFDCLCANTATIGGSRGHAKLLPPLVGSQAVSYRPFTPLKTAPQMRAKATLIQALRQTLTQLRLVQRLRPCFEGTTEVLPYGSSPYVFLLQHFAELTRRPDEFRLAADQQLSLEVLRVIDQARSEAGS